jgi:alkylhydroperoxidase/carboxymuconolactone decarboxylase family protein YurZ
MTMDTDNKPDLLGVAESLRQHGRPSQIAFMVYELLTANDYTDEEILEVAAALEDIVS